jgi:hypothetical protein
MGRDKMNILSRTMDKITKPETIEAVKQANLRLGIYCSNDPIDIQLLVNYIYTDLQKIEATNEEVTECMDRMALGVLDVEKPRSLNASFFVQCVNALRKSRVVKEKVREEKRELTEEEAEYHIGQWKKEYKNGNWPLYRLTSGWIADRLKLDYSPYLVKARLYVTQEKKAEAINRALPFVHILADLSDGSVIGEAKRMAVEQYFKNESPV